MIAAGLRTEYLKNPIGLGNLHPHFFWRCEGGIRQKAYQIICTREGKEIWNTGWRQSSSSTHIRYEGEPLHSRERVEWSVCLRDENDQVSERSSSFFEIGLTEPSDMTAKWIAGDYIPQPTVRQPADCFRKKFKIHGQVVKARLYASARGVYDVTVNGIRIESFILAPGITDYRKRIQLQTYDVTDCLSKENTVELRLADGWYRGSCAAYGVRNVYGKQTSITAQMEITYSDGKTERICTDNSWEWSNDGPVRFADLKDGEVYNACMRPSYNGKAVEVKAPEAGLVCPDNVPVTEHERLPAKLLPKKVLDFEQNIAGYLEFSIKGRPGQRVKITCGEVLDDDGNVDLSGIREIRPAKGWTQTAILRKLMQNKVSGETAFTPLQEIIFTCSGGEDRYKTSFAVFGFRYAQIETELDIHPENFTAIAVYSDLEQTGTFTCSDDRVNRLVENTRWSMKSNFLDIPTDCPTRERLGWTGDAQIFFDTGAYLMNTAPFFRKWLRDMEDAQMKNGLLPAVLPFEGVDIMYKATGSSVGWADAVYLIPYRFMKRFGDHEILKQCLPMIKRYADYLTTHLEKDGHYEKGVHLGEWLEPEEFREQKYGAGIKHPEECTAYLYLAMTTIAEIAEELGDGETAKKLRGIADRAKAVYPKYARLDTDRQAKLVRPLAFGLLDGEMEKDARRRLKRAVENYGYRVGTGFLSTPFILGVLTESGEADTAYRMLLNEERPGWLAEISDGATTVWEDWEGRSSHNHYSPGAVVAWLFDTCAGIRQAGENHFILSPVPGDGLNFAEAEVNTIYGTVKAHWDKDGNGIRYRFVIPANCTARIVLPDGTSEEVCAGTFEYGI